MRKDINKMVAGLNRRLGLDDSLEWDSQGITVDYHSDYGGYRLETEKGSTGFARDAGQRRRGYVAFMAYLEGMHQLLDYIDMANQSIMSITPTAKEETK